MKLKLLKIDPRSGSRQAQNARIYHKKYRYNHSQTRAIRMAFAGGHIENPSKYIFRTSGLSIIEISIAMLISSLLTLALYQAFNTAQKVSESISATIHAETTFAIAYNQLEKDISALFVPERVFTPPYAQATAGREKTTDKTAEKPLFKDVFAGVFQDKNLESISFLSTHSLPLYNSKSPNAVRIVYRLSPQENSDYYKLTRQESTQLDLSPVQFKEKNIRAYNVMNNIMSLSISFTVTELDTKESTASPSTSRVLSEAKNVSRGETEQKKSEQPTPKKYKILTAWPKSEGEKKSDYLVPAYITLKGIFVDGMSNREYPFEWIFPVLVYDDVMLRLKNTDKKNPKETIEQNKDEKPKENTSQPPKNPGSGGQKKTGGLILNIPINK